MRVDRLERGANDVLAELGEVEHGLCPRVNSRGQVCAQARLTVNLLLVSACSRAALDNPRAREKFCQSLSRRRIVHWGPRHGLGSHTGGPVALAPVPKAGGGARDLT